MTTCSRTNFMLSAIFTGKLVSLVQLIKYTQHPIRQEFNLLSFSVAFSDHCTVRFRSSGQWETSSSLHPRNDFLRCRTHLDYYWRSSALLFICILLFTNGLLVSNIQWLNDEQWSCFLLFYSNISSMKMFARRVGMILLCYDICIFSHLFISLNRMCAICFPLKYGVYFRCVESRYNPIFLPPHFWHLNMRWRL